MFYIDGSLYEGQWVNGLRNGFGTMIYETGEKYQGKWQGDVPHGDGNLTYPNDFMYSGEWKNGARSVGEYLSKYHSKTRFVLCKWVKDSPSIFSIEKIIDREKRK